MRPIFLGLLIGVSADVSVNDGRRKLLRTADLSIKQHNYGTEASDPSACTDDDQCHSINTEKPYCMKGICRICWMAQKDECKGYCKWVDEYHRQSKKSRSSCELNTSEFPGSDSCNYQEKKETCQNAGCHWIRATVYVNKSIIRRGLGYLRACVSEIDCTETHFGSHCKPCWQNDGTPCKSKDKMGRCYTTKNKSICGEGCDSVKPAMSACFCGGSMCSIGQTCSSRGVYMTLRSGAKNHPRVCTSSSCVFNIKALIQNADDTTCGSTLRAGERCKVNCKIDYKDSGSLECSTMGQLSQIPTCTRFNETTELLVYVQSSITIKYISKVITNITSFITETLKNNIAKFLKNPTKNIIILDVTRTTDSTFVVKFRVAVPDDRSKSDIQTTLGSNTFSESIIDSVTTIITTVTSVKVEVGSATILTIHQRESVLSYECGPETAAAECLCGGEKCQPFHICDNGKCTPPDCLVPNITNALNFDCGDTLKPGKECTVTCESDYRPSGSLKCGESLGLMSTIMVCRPVDKDVVETDIYVWSFVTLQITTTGSWETVLRSVKQSIVETLKVSEADMKIPKAFKRGFRYLVQFGLKVTDTATQSDLSQNVDSFNTTTFINQMAINIKDTKVLQVNIGQTSISKIHRVSTTAPPPCDEKPAMGACQCGESVCTVGERCNRSTIPACTKVNIYEVRSNITLTVNSVPEIHESNIKIVMTRFIAERLEVELHHVYIIKIVKNVNLETRYTVEFRVRVYDEVNSQKLETTITTGVIFQTTTINITIQELTYTISTTNVKVHSTTTSMINEPASTPALSQNIECEDNSGKTQVGKTCSCVNPENGFLANCMAGHYCLPSGECTKENVENVEFAVGNRRQFVVLRPQNVATCGSYEKCVGFFEVDKSKKTTICIGACDQKQCCKPSPNNLYAPSAPPLENQCKLYECGPGFASDPAKAETICALFCSDSECCKQSPSNPYAPSTPPYTPSTCGSYEKCDGFFEEDKSKKTTICIGACDQKQCCINTRWCKLDGQSTKRDCPAHEVLPDGVRYNLSTTSHDKQECLNVVTREPCDEKKTDFADISCWCWAKFIKVGEKCQVPGLDMMISCEPDSTCYADNGHECVDGRYGCTCRKFAPFNVCKNGFAPMNTKLPCSDPQTQRCGDTSSSKYLKPCLYPSQTCYCMDSSATIKLQTIGGVCQYPGFSSTRQRLCVPQALCLASNGQACDVYNVLQLCKCRESIPPTRCKYLTISNLFAVSGGDIKGDCILTVDYDAQYGNYTNSAGTKTWRFTPESKFSRLTIKCGVAGHRLLGTYNSSVSDVGDEASKTGSIIHIRSVGGRRKRSEFRIGFEAKCKAEICIQDDTIPVGVPCICGDDDCSASMYCYKNTASDDKPTCHSKAHVRLMEIGSVCKVFSTSPMQPCVANAMCFTENHQKCASESQECICREIAIHGQCKRRGKSMDTMLECSSPESQRCVTEKLQECDHENKKCFCKGLKKIGSVCKSFGRSITTKKVCVPKAECFAKNGQTCARRWTKCTCQNTPSTCASYTCYGERFTKDDSKTTTKCEGACTNALCCKDLTDDYFKDLLAFDPKPSVLSPSNRKCKFHICGSGFARDHTKDETTCKRFCGDSECCKPKTNKSFLQSQK